MLKLGMATYAFLWTWPLERVLEKAAEWGFRRVEIMASAPHLWPRETASEDLVALKSVLDAHGLTAVALCPTFLDLNLASPNVAFRAESITQVKETIRMAHTLGVELVTVIPGRRHPLVPQPLEQVWELGRSALAECAREAAACGVVIGLENAPTRFLDGAAELRRMVEEVDSDHVGIAFDVANNHGVEPVVDALETVGEYLVHVHLSDMSRERWAHLPAGMGEVDFAGVAATLDQIRFDGTSIIEATDMDSCDGGMVSSKRELEVLGWSA